MRRRSSTRWHRAGALGVWLLAALRGAHVAGAQTPQGFAQASPTDPPSATAFDAAPVEVPCDGKIVSAIIVRPARPYANEVPSNWSFLRRAAAAFHATSRADVLKRFLVLTVGGSCSSLRRAESERILRSQRFLGDVHVRAFDDSAGGVRIEVDTRDEFSVVFAPIFSHEAPLLRGVRIGELNLAGTARIVEVEWRDVGPYGSVYGARYVDRLFGGRRDELQLEARKNFDGELVRASLVRPAYTDWQRFAFVASADASSGYAPLRRPAEADNAIQVRQQSAVLGGVFRFGSAGRLRLAGLSLTRSTLRTADSAVLVTADGFRPDTGTPIGLAYGRQNVVRANVLGGVSLLRFVPVEGYDALSAAQDVRIGVQLGVMLGQSIPIGAARDLDQHLAVDLYAGVGGPRVFLGAQFIGEGRRARDTGVWDNQVMSGRIAWYFRPAIHQLTLLSTQWSDGRNVRSPFQLSFADHDGGVQGYGRSQETGARRVVMHAEQRMMIPSRLNVADLGFAVFAEAGRLWGDASVPYAVDTPWRRAVGVSVLAAAPPRSRRLWRVDLAAPLDGRGHRLEVRISSSDHTREFWREPIDIAAARESTSPAGFFSWP